MYCSTASEDFFLYENVSRSRTQSALHLVWRRANFSHFTPFFCPFFPVAEPGPRLYRRKHEGANWPFHGRSGFVRCISKFVQDLNTLVHWADTWQMSFNAKKWTILRVSCSTSPVEYQYTIHREPLQAVDHSKYLGVELSSYLTWDVHIASIIGKANRSLGFIRRNLNKCLENVNRKPTLLDHSLSMDVVHGTRTLKNR